jgi:hypothetical protein
VVPIGAAIRHCYSSEASIKVERTVLFQRDREFKFTPPNQLPSTRTVPASLAGAVFVPPIFGKKKLAQVAV